MEAQDGRLSASLGDIIADALVVRRDLAVILDPLDVLTLLRTDAHPFALVGAWAGGGAVLGSEPAAISSPPDDIGEVLGARSAASLVRPQPSAETGQARFGGGWVGYLGYGLAGYLHALPPAPGGPRKLPRWWFGYYDHVLGYDAGSGTWTFEALVTPERSAAIEARFADLAGRMRAAAAQPVPAPGSYTCGEFEVTPAPAEHQQSVARAVDLIHAGDMFQANITLQLDASFSGDPLDLFCRGASRLRPPYAAFLRLAGDQAVASFSPELFLRRTGASVQASPIKGTS